MTNIEDFSLKELQDLESHIPELSGFISRVLAKTYDEFIDVFYADIDTIINQIQKNPELRKNDSEDRLTIEIEGLLNTMGYDASHDEKVGGHADLLVKKKTFLWIGEAKIHKSYSYLWQGFNQLTTRYSTGDSSYQKDGGIIIYIRCHRDTKSIMKRWEQELSKKGLEDYSSMECKKRSLSFFSTHKHQRSGEAFRVRHMPVMLYFQPQDRGNRTSTS
jgi:hypothetical protein